MLGRRRAIGRRIGCYQLALMGTAKEGTQASSFNYTEGRTDELAAAPIERYAGIEQVLRDTTRQVHTQPLAAKFVGDVVLMPMAAASLFAWLLGQLADAQLLAELLERFLDLFLLFKACVIGSERDFLDHSQHLSV